MTDKIIGREIRLKSRPIDSLSEDNFEIVKVNIPKPKEGEILVHSIWLSLDPHLRSYLTRGTKLRPAIELHSPIWGGCIGRVIDSHNKEYRVGDYVFGNYGWREYWISNPENNNGIKKIDSKIAPVHWHLGLLGMSGFTAYVGLLKIGNLKDGKDVVFVSAAAGAVGSLACQIAKIKNCYVVGSAGSEEKVKWLLDEAKIDYAFNYKKLGSSNSISSELKKACPHGIDLYFDNVGGKHLEAAIDSMNIFGRVVLCGATSTSSSAGPSNLSLAIPHRLKLQGYLFSDHYDMLDEFQTEMKRWIEGEKIKWKETIFEGLENTPKAFIGLFDGKNIGKALVKIGLD